MKYERVMAFHFSPSNLNIDIELVNAVLFVESYLE